MEVSDRMIHAMAEVRCVDSSVLQVQPVPVLDRDGLPYEVSLRLLRDGERFGEVGERCGYFLASTASRLRAARAAAPVPADAFPASALEAGLRAWVVDEGQDVEALWPVLQRYLPRDRELFAFRSRDPDDLTAVGELRVLLDVERKWAVGPDSASAGHWRLRPVADLRAWGAGGIGVRAVLTSDSFLFFLETLVQDFATVGVCYAPEEDASSLSRPVG